MAWRCTGKSNAQLVANLKHNGIIHSDKVAAAMNAVDRGNYVLRSWEAYEDSPQYIGHNATISAPHMHAYAVEHLLPYLRPGARVLDVGSGSGYLVAVLHHLVSPGGVVVGIDHIKGLVDDSVINLRKDGMGQAIDDGEIVMVTGDGRAGWSENAPYDAIHVGAAAPSIPEALLEQMASPGRMFIPVGEYMQYIEQVDKDAHGHISKKDVMAVRYVPLTDREAQEIN
ncbi:protein-L-isoaspartate O-methyltransferase [Pholiota conissans]|uniref:Protein-L-isoaspartate O-methyltransferase n=1 Tax=Pholiota conissans TaxID=109636 RepID=A0A9P6CU90_9AGAR|nr:protein-L-isoaspartate O-methyltransferase [Pholiota conissans]